MDLLQFIVLSFINLALILFVIRKWSFFSAEGFCIAILGAMILTDNVQLIFHYVVSPNVLFLGYEEFRFRIYPTLVHVVGLAVLIAALYLCNPRPQPVIRQLDKQDILRLRNIGIAITVFGLFLSAVALYLVSGLSTLDFYVALSAFRTEALPFGGFWYRGADIAVFGLALTLPSLRGKSERFFLVLLLMMFVSFFLRTNKGGLEGPIVWGAYVLYVYDRAYFKSLFKLRTIALTCAIMFAGIGLKSWFLPWALHRATEPPRSVEHLVQMATATIATRWGDDSVYRSYCQFVNSLPDHRFLFPGHRVGLYTLTSWVPRLLYPNKPDHPFRGIGFMVYADFHTFPMETPSPSLMGAVMADDGLVSLTGYLFLTGIFLSVLRRVATGSGHSLYSHVGYVIFTLFGGLSAESGVLGLVYTLILAWGIVAFAWFVLLLISLPAVPPRIRWLGRDAVIRDGST